ncbi:general substrate transporter [Geopyxis carbonaria]|nr:general substrate transporter [Geopyxis carbonaria]
MSSKMETVHDIQDEKNATLVAFNDATNAEHAMTFKQAWRTEKGVFLWAAVFASAALSWGFDAQVNGAVLSIASFRRDFGYMFEGKPVLPAAWQTAFNTVSSVGQFFGGLGAGYLADRVGRKWAMWIGSWALLGGIAMETAATSRVFFCVAKIILGVGLGFYLSLAPGYCSEVSPTVLRGITGASVSLCIICGQLLSNAVIKGWGEREDRWAYRAPFLVQLLIPTFLLVILPFAPESPWYLLRKDKYEEARRSLERLHGKDNNIDSKLIHIRETIAREDELSSSATWMDCFRGTDARRTMVSIGVFCCQHLSGIIFVLGYSTYFFQLAGLATSDTFSLGVGVTACGVIGNMFSWWLVNCLGRRPILLGGEVILTIILFLMGIFDVIPTKGAAWAQAIVTVVYAFVYLTSLGAMSYVILSEASSVRLRSKTMGLAAAVQSLWGIVMNIMMPYLVNPDEANLKGKVGFIFGGTSLLATMWVYFCVPEMKGLTFSEIDEKFVSKVSARRFAEKRGHQVSKEEARVD